LFSEVNRRMEFRSSCAPLFRDAKERASTHCWQSEYHLRVAQEDVTFAPIGKASSVPGLMHPLARAVRPFKMDLNKAAQTRER
jgi:hypothetical protein